MFDAQQLLDRFLGGRNPDGSRKGPSPDLIKGLAGGAAAGGLAAILLGSKPGKKLAKTAIKVGGAAALAGLAYKVWNDWQASKTESGAAPQAPMKDVTPRPGSLAPPAPDAEMSLAILRAMIAAAKADGHVDDQERRKIFAKLEEAGVAGGALAFVMDELQKPLDVDAVIAAATTPEKAVELYAASLLAIDPDDPAEQAYLAMLASRLKLDPGLKAHIERETAKVLA